MNYLRIAIFMVILTVFLVCGCEDDQTTTPTPRYSETGADTFVVGDSVSIQIRDFVGGLTVNTGAPDTILVNFTKWAPRKNDLARITVSTSQAAGEIIIFADNPSDINDAAVDFDVTAPSGSELNLRAAVGSITCNIRPAGICQFGLGTGNIVLRLPGDIGAIVHLATGIGEVTVDFPVDGNVSKNSVEGTIGAGDEVEISAQTAVGSIHVLRQ